MVQPRVRLQHKPAYSFACSGLTLSSPEIKVQEALLPDVSSTEDIILECYVGAVRDNLDSSDSDSDQKLHDIIPASTNFDSTGQVISASST